MMVIGVEFEIFNTEGLIFLLLSMTLVFMSGFYEVFLEFLSEKHFSNLFYAFIIYPLLLRQFFPFESDILNNGLFTNLFSETERWTTTTLDLLRSKLSILWIIFKSNIFLPFIFNWYSCNNTRYFEVISRS